jgi:hypothetical protein
MCAWTYGTIYSWQLEMDLYQSSLPTVFTAIPVLYTIAESPLERLLGRLLGSLLGSLLESLLKSLFESLFESRLRAFLREPRTGRRRVFHGKLLADGTL